MQPLDPSRRAISPHRISRFQGYLNDAPTGIGAALRVDRARGRGAGGKNNRR